MHLTNTAKFAVQRVLRSLGWEIRRFELSDIAFLVNQMQERGIQMVLDVGANQGQYAALLYQKGYAGRVVSFEPLPEAHDYLCGLAAKQAGWSVHRRCAIGARPGKVSLNVSGNLVSSSILPMHEDHVAASRASRYVRVEETDVVSLDSLPECWSAGRTFLKIDTQGYEMEVLKGGADALRHIVGVQLEVSVAALYEGQPDYMELLALMRSSGFAIWDIAPGFREPASGRLLQFDAVFFRNG